jgi:hypothetical protein
MLEIFGGVFCIVVWTIQVMELRGINWDVINALGRMIELSDFPFDIEISK